MKNIVKVLSLLLALIFVLPIFTACEPQVETQGKHMVTIQWVQGQKVLKEEIVEKGTKLTEWTPEGSGEFQGWYERPYIKRFDFSKPVTKSMIIYASFKGGTEGGTGDPVMPDWYLIGAGKGDLNKCNNWNHEASAKNLGLYAGEDGIYRVTLNLYEGDQFKMTANMGWDDEKAIDKMAGFANGSVKDENGKVVFTAGENNNFVVAEGCDGKYEITYDATADVMGFKFIEALEKLPDDIRLIGDLNGWGTSYGEDDYKFTSADGENWTYTWEVTTPGTFKVYNNLSGVYYPGGTGNDLHIDEVGTYTIYFNSKTRNIVVKDANGNNVDVGFTGDNGGGEGGGTTVTPNSNPVDKVYMVLNSDWNDGSIVGAWVWAKGADGQMVVATPTSDANVYEVAIPAGTNLIVFFDLNAGATELGDQWANRRVQSEDMAIPDKSDDKVYYHVSNGTWSNSSENAGSGSGSGTPGQLPEGQGILVFFQNNWKWTEVSAYYWGTASDPTWPGNAMTVVGEVDGYEVYAIRIPEGVSGLIFNGKKDDGSGQLDQTPDITEGITDGKGWKMEWNNGNIAAEFIYNPDGCSHSSEGEGTVVVAATCTTGGQKSYVCSKCGETYTLNTPALGHSYGSDGKCIACGIGSVYTVVGQAGLCGSDWNTNDESNNMTYDEATGVYTKVYENVAAGTYEYKVVLNHKWGAGEYPTNGANSSLTVATDGSTVTIRWNPTAQTLEAIIS